MAAIAWTDVVNAAPELATFNATLQTVFLDMVNGDGFNPDAFDGEDGPKTRLARIYLLAHLATLSARSGDGASGSVVSESLGPQSRSYGNNFDPIDADLSSTPYGQVYAYLRRIAIGGVIQAV